MDSLSRIMRADWGAPVKSAAYRAAYVVAVLIVAAEYCYRAGIATGQAVHWLSDRLAGLASGRIDRAQTARAAVQWAHATLGGPAAPVPAAPVPAAPVPAAPVPAAPVLTLACALGPTAPVAISAPRFDTLTVTQLRKLARARGLSKLARNGRRADLLLALTA